MFSEDFTKLSGSDQTRFAEVCNKLLLKGFVVREFYDPREKTMRNSQDYKFIERYFDIFENYLKFSGWTLKRDENLGVYALFNDYEDNRIRIDREASVILVTLRKIYDDQRQESQTSAQSGQAIYLTTNGLIGAMKIYGIFMPGKRLTGRLVGKSLRFLANHNIIAKVSGSYDEGNVNFFILPSIVYALDNDKVVAMSNALDELRAKEKENQGGLVNEDAYQG